MQYAYRIPLFALLCLGAYTIYCLESNNERTKMNENMKDQSQGPKQPYHYREEEVYYSNETCGVRLAGTLTLPKIKGRYPAVLLISGMGPTNRDAETYVGHKPFLVLADYLTQRGFAVLRVDKRGVGKSTGFFNATVTIKDLADDVIAGINYLKTREDIDAYKIGLIGHSEGALIATLVAGQSMDVAFIVLMGAMVTAIDASIEHTALQLRADGASEEIITRDKIVRNQVLQILLRENNPATAEEQMLAAIEHYWAALPEALQKESEKLLFAFSKSNAVARVKMYNSLWYRSFITYSLADALKQVKVPVLALNGEKDWIASPTLSFPVMTKALTDAGNHDYTLITLQNLNHSLQTCQTGSIAEYAAIKEAIAPMALKTLCDWISSKTK